MVNSLFKKTRTNRKCSTYLQKKMYTLLQSARLGTRARQAILGQFVRNWKGSPSRTLSMYDIVSTLKNNFYSQRFYRERSFEASVCKL